MKRTRSQRRLATPRLGVALTVFGAAAIGFAGAVDARGDPRAEPRGRRYCSATAEAQLRACQLGASGDLVLGTAKCLNVVDEGERAECYAEIRAARREDLELCRAQRRARQGVCKELGEGRFDPDFDPADFDDDFENLSRPNPYFPLGIGYRWEYVGSGDELDTIEVLDKTKLIEGVNCIVVNDRVLIGGELHEDTDDWYAQRKDGTVVYCGESVRNFEGFEGDEPPEPELIDVGGQWKAGRDGDPLGTFSLGSPTVGAVARSSRSRTPRT